VQPAASMVIRERRVTSEAIQVHGGYGFTEEFPVSRFYRGARYGTLGGGTTETLKDLIGRRIIAGVDPVDGILGLGAFRWVPSDAVRAAPWHWRDSAASA
jgi:hypothetical protein